MTSLFGHDTQFSAFAKAAGGGKLHHGWIFAGPRGVGKARFAAEAARLLVDPGNAYSSMIDNRSHPDIIWVQRLPKETPREGEETDPKAELKRSIVIDQIREVQQRLTTRASIAERRVVIIDAADELERGGANALLKSLEEPPAGTYFMLVSHASDRLLPTIRSRCQMVRLDPLDDEAMRKAMAALLPAATGAEIDALVRSGRGLPGQALNLAGMDFGAIERIVDGILRSGDPHSKLRYKLAEQLSAKTAQGSYEALLRHIPAKIAAEARHMEAPVAIKAVEAFHEADRLAARAIGLTLDKQAVVLQMGCLLAGLYNHR
ncbi:MAG: DNA polymerase III subunit delta' [Sphingorhabdus sp.]